jgi:hypothetical protein
MWSCKHHEVFCAQAQVGVLKVFLHDQEPGLTWYLSAKWEIGKTQTVVRGTFDFHGALPPPNPNSFSALFAHLLKGEHCNHFSNKDNSLFFSAALVKVAQACNSSYLGGGNWDDCSSRPAWANSSQDPTSTNGWMQLHTPVIPATQRSTNRRITVQTHWAQSKTLSQK